VDFDDRPPSAVFLSHEPVIDSTKTAIKVQSHQPLAIPNSELKCKCDIGLPSPQPSPKFGRGSKKLRFFSGSPSPGVGRSGICSGRGFANAFAFVPRRKKRMQRSVRVPTARGNRDDDSGAHQAARQDRGWGMRASHLKQSQRILNLELPINHLN
jgi:hypothetical protein